MSVAVSRTKITVPARRPDLFTRSRLAAHLDDILDYPLTLISAPAGYGKTSLMIDLADQATYPICWYSIDSLDVDPKRFLAHLVHSLQSSFPEFGKQTLALLDARSNPLENTAEIVSAFTNDLYQSITEHFVIFFDDYHNLDGVKQINKFTSRFAQEMDVNAHLVIASRRLILFPDLPLLIGRRSVKAIDYTDLSFRADEIRDFYNKVLGRSISVEDSRKIEEITEGWITGLLLSAPADIPLESGQKKLKQVTGLDLFSYLAEQVFETLARRTQEFLLRSSIFNEFNLDLCREVIGTDGEDDLAEIIEDLLRQNLFIQELTTDSSWYRYHLLFRDFLRDRFHRVDPELETTLLRRLLEHYSNQKQWEDAYHLTLILKDVDLTVKVIINASSAMIKEGRIYQLLKWLDGLPRHIFDHFPYLLILHGISLASTGNPTLGLKSLNQAIRKSEIRSDPQHFTRALLCRATTNRILGYYTESIDDTDVLFDQYSKLNIDESTISEVKREKALAMYNLGDFEQSINLFKEAVSGYQLISDSGNEAIALQDLGLVHQELGQYNVARRHFLTAQSTWEDQKNKTQLSNLLNNIGTLDLLEGRYVDAYQILLEAKSYAEDTFNKRILGYTLASLGELALALQLNNKSLSLFEQAIEIAEEVQDYFLLSYVYIKSSISNRYIGRIHCATDQINTAKVFITQKTSPLLTAMWELENGFVLLEYDNEKDAGIYFERARNFYRRNQKYLECANALLGILICNWKLKGINKINDSLIEWEDGIKRVNHIHPLFPEIRNHWALLEKAISESEQSKHTRRILDEYTKFCRQLPDLQLMISPENALQEDNPLGQLQITAFGETSVTRDGQPIRASEWIHQRTAREIFYYLLAHPQGVKKEQIGLEFWPESSPSQLTCQFKNAMYRLRRALGKDAILYDKKTRRYHFNRSLPYVYDVEDFMSFAKSANREEDLIRKVNLYIKVTETYKHPYASDINNIWFETIRKDLQQMYLDALLFLAEFYYYKGNYSSCIANCNDVLLLEPYNECALILTIQGIFELKGRIDVIRFFEDYKKRLFKDYKVHPSIKANDLFQKLIG